MAAALIPVVGRAAAQLGLGAAASKVIDMGINRAIPYAMQKAKEATSKYKVTHGISNAIAKAEKGYNSKTGQKVRDVASLAGSLVAFGGSGKMLKTASKGVGMAGAGLRQAVRRVGGSLKKGNPLLKIPKRYQQAKSKLSEGATKLSQGATKIQKRMSKAGRKVRERVNPKPPSKQQLIADQYEKEILKTNAAKRGEWTRAQREQFWTDEYPKEMEKLQQGKFRL